MFQYRVHDDSLYSGDKNGSYNGIMTDLNTGRYRNYMMAYELAVVAGEPDERLPHRAAQLKEKMKELWNEDA